MVTKVSDVFDNQSNEGGSTVFPGARRVYVDELFNVPIVIHDVRWLRADPGKHSFYIKGQPRFAVFLCSYADEDPELDRFTTHTGSIEVCHRLLTLQRRGLLPAEGTLVKNENNSYSLI